MTAGADAVLVVPTVAPGRGGGHLLRSAALVRELRSAGIRAYLAPSVYGPDPEARGKTRGLADFKDLGLPEGADAERMPWRCVVLDGYRTPAPEFSRWAPLAPLVGIDEGGPFRDGFDYLLDILPGPADRSAPNRQAPELLALPRRRRPSFEPADPRGPLRVLISFGAEDPAGLSVPAALSLARFPGLAIDLLFGPLAAQPHPADRVRLQKASVRLLDPQPELREVLADYDLLITHYGLTAFEAAYARLPVGLLSPSAYHEKLARTRGFFSAGRGKGAAAGIGGLLAGPEGPKRTVLEDVAEATARAAAAARAAPPSPPSPPEGGSAAALVGNLVFPSRGRCPLCGGRPSPGDGALARFSDRTYRRCARCGIVYLTRSAPPPIRYDENYFFAEYRAQYGKTYLEDFTALRQKGRERLERIRHLLAGQLRGGKAPRPRLLDIGCAYGPFLAAAADGGFEPLGLDPAAAAVGYVGEKLGLAAVQGTFPAAAPRLMAAGGQFDVVSLWYVIEHFEDVGAALAALSGLVRPGGVLAFSTPSFSGVSGRKNSRRFLENSPADHWTIWEPARVAALLRRFGFRLEKIVVTGHHPERFPLMRAGSRRGWIYRLLWRVSGLFGLGDTFEVYAIRTEDRSEHG